MRTWTHSFYCSSIFQPGFLNCEGSGVEVVVMDVLTLMAGRKLEIRVRGECEVFGAWKRAPLARFPALAAGTRSGQAGKLAAPFG